MLQREGLSRPTVLHLKTEKGFGYPPALAAPDRMHGVEAAPHLALHAGSSSSSSSSSKGLHAAAVRPADAAAAAWAAEKEKDQQQQQQQQKQQQKQQQNQQQKQQQEKVALSPTAAAAAAAAAAPGAAGATATAAAGGGGGGGSGQQQRVSLTSIFSRGLLQLAAADTSLVCITAAMPGGTGLALVGSLLPQQLYDVGIAEQHAATFAAGLAAAAAKPFCCIYSSFLQRAYDQIIHDVAIQNLPVR